MAQFPEDCKPERRNRDGQETDDEVALKPIQSLSAIEHDLQAGKANRDQQYADVINLKLACGARRFHFALEFGWVRDDPARKDERHDSDRNINKEDPAPGET